MSSLISSSCWGKFKKVSSTQMAWSAFDVDGLAEAFAVGGALHLLVNLLLLATRMKRMKMMKAQASFRQNDEEPVAQQVLNQRDGGAGASKDFLSISMTSENRAILGEAEALDRVVGSPDKSLWTALSAFESDTNDISETKKQEREAQLKKAMCERVVRDDWPVYRREWVRFGEKIAEGGQAEIYAATLEQPSVYDVWPLVAVVVKKFKHSNAISQGHNPPGLKFIKCIHVCRPTGVFLDDGQLCLIMPRLDGDLRAVIDRKLELHSAPPFTKPVALHIIKQVAMGLKGLHEVGIYHRDLKAGNILVEERKWKGLDSYTVYISDFESSDSVIGTGFYRAPEVLRHLQARSQARTHGPLGLCEHEWAAADVYSFGMVCYEILTGGVPKIGDKWSDFSMALSGHRPELPPGVVPEGLRIMIERCWHKDPQCRPTPSEIMQYIKRIDNDGVYIPAPITASTEFLVDVLDFIFQPLYLIRQQLFPAQKFVELRMLLYSLISSRIVGLWKGPIEMVLWRDWLYLHKSARLSELGMVFHAAWMHQSRKASTDGLHIDVRKALIGAFAEPLFIAGVWMPSVCIQSEVIIRQTSDRKHRWALRRHLFFLCVLNRLGIEVEYLPFLFNWLFLAFIRVRVLDSPGNFIFRYTDMSPAIGIRLLLMPYIGARALPHLYWRLLSFISIFYFYAFFVDNAQRFNYLCLLNLAYNVVRHCAAHKQAGFSPHYYFHGISSFIYS